MRHLPRNRFAFLSASSGATAPHPASEAGPPSARRPYRAAPSVQGRAEQRGVEQRREEEQPCGEKRILAEKKEQTAAERLAKKSGKPSPKGKPAGGSAPPLFSAVRRMSPRISPGAQETQTECGGKPKQPCGEEEYCEKGDPLRAQGKKLPRRTEKALSRTA